MVHEPKMNDTQLLFLNSDAMHAKQEKNVHFCAPTRSTVTTYNRPNTDYLPDR